MFNNNITTNGVNETRTDNSESLAPGRCSAKQQRGPGRHPATVANKRVKWTKEYNKLAIECFLRSQPNVRGYRKRMLTIWNEKGLFKVSEAQLASQTRCIRDREWLSSIEIEEIKRKVDQQETKVSDEVEQGSENRPLEEQSEVEMESQVFSNFEIQPDNELNNDQIQIAKMLQTKLGDPTKLEHVNLRNMDHRKVQEKTKVVNDVINIIRTTNITETNNLILAGANVVAELLGKRRKTINYELPWWKRRILAQINTIRKDISKMEQWKNNNLGKEDTKLYLEWKYHIRNKGLNAVIEELKQRVKAKTAKIKKI